MAAALNARKAGFSGVEIHSANGYLLNQFLESKTNLRDDRYGGSLDNKFRFLREVLAAVLEVWPSGRVGVRLSPNGVFNDIAAIEKVLHGIFESLNPGEEIVFAHKSLIEELYALNRVSLSFLVRIRINLRC